jgi:hypothetical protein
MRLPLLMVSLHADAEHVEARAAVRCGGARPIAKPIWLKNRGKNAKNAFC